MDIILETPGTRIGKKKGMLKISVPDRDSTEVPLREVESLLVGNGVQITTQALKSLAQQAVNIIYTSMGTPYGMFTPFANVGTVFTRREQLAAYNDWRGVHVAIQITKANIENKRRLLLYFAKSRKESNRGKYMTLRAAARDLGRRLEDLSVLSKGKAKGQRIENIRHVLMGIEGKATAVYFRDYGNLFPPGFWSITRTRRPPKDALNALLSLGYMVLLGHVNTAIAAAGLELYGGYLHSDRSGKPSLALDLIEEFRQPVVDRLVSRLVQKNQIQKDDFVKSIHGRRLKDDKKELFYSELRKEIMGGDTSEELFKEPEALCQDTKGKININYKREMVRQARKLANFLIGASEAYEPFITNW